MDFVSLIANTGVQFIDFKLRLDPEKFKNLRFNYSEGIDSSTLSWWFEELIEIKEIGSYIRKSDLEELKIERRSINSSAAVQKIQDSGRRLFVADEERTYVVRNAEKTLRRFEKVWIPLPYFRNNQINDNLFGPTDWVRMWYEFLPNYELQICLAVDTTISDTDQNVTPLLNSNPNENKYNLCVNEDSLLSFFSEFTGCSWVEKWLGDLIKPREDESQTLHLTTFVHLIRILNSDIKLPVIQLLTDKGDLIDLDLSIDVGNSHTCAILFETPIEGDVKFNHVKKLQIRDLNCPTRTHSDSFSTRVVFRDEQFGMKDSYFAKYEKFAWPSPVRIGFEAEELIKSFHVKRNVQHENKSFYSSPKRYLWDDQMSKHPWNYHDLGQEIPKKVYRKGISEQLKSDGTLCTDGAWGATPMYSRRTLMTFLFLEIFSQAISQFNSFQFRSSHGRPNARRRLRHVLISCPTAMIKVEQIALRKAAEDAVQILKNFSGKVNNEDAAISPVIADAFEIIPKLKNIRLNLDELERKDDWMYDEATCAQFVFLYGLIQHKFDGNSHNLFKLFGRKSKDGSNVLTVGSLDIGGGTSDLMICEYGLNYDNSTELIPNPLYYESFHLAGDDLMKNIIQHIVIEGREKTEDDLLCSGVIENFGYNLYGDDISEKLNGFFGKDAANMSYLSRMQRINFLNQIGIPLAHAYLECANSGETVTASYSDIFSSKPPSQDLLRYFEDHFGFRFEDLKWRLNPKKVNQVIKDTFSKLIMQVAKLMHRFNCDYVVISGRPCSFLEIERLILEVHPVQPNRFVNLNNYWIGKWYPFADNNGYVKDPKTIVATGALIGFMATKFYKLKKFKINPKYLIQNLNSTANYAGTIRDNVIKEVLLSPTKNKATFKVYGIPHSLGVKNIDSKNYPARFAYQLIYNEKFISNTMQMTNVGKAQDLINKLNAKLPFEITISREIDVDKEKVVIEEITDNEGESLAPTMLSLRVVTLSNEHGYWFDTAEFALSINSRN